MAGVASKCENLSSEISKLKHSEYVLDRVSSLWESKVLTDVSLKVQGKVIKAHKLVLTACSDYFRAMFTGRMKESSAKTVDLGKEGGLVYEAVQALLDYMYKATLELTTDNVFDILVAADYLQVTDVLEICCKFIVEEVVNNNLCIENYLRICGIADRHGLVEIREETERKFALIFSDVAETDEFKEQITLEELERLLVRDDLGCPSETFVFKAVLGWIEFSRETRLCYVADLLRNVRLALVDIDVLITEIGESGLQEIPECKTMLFDASLYHNRRSATSRFAMEYGKPRIESKVLVAFTGQLSNGTFFFSSKENRWKRLSGMATHACRSPCAAAVSGNALYLSDGATKRCYEYNISNNKWSTLPLMKFEKETLKLCILGDYLYALGGNSPERYSFIKRQWQCIAQPIESQPQRGATFVTFDGYIFAIGGDNFFRGNCVDPSRSVYRFNPVTNKWKASANTNVAHINAAVFVDNGVLHVAGGEKALGRTKLQPSNVVETYDHEQNAWSRVPQHHIPPNNLGAIETSGKVFFIKGLSVIDSGIRIPPGEVYHISLNGWSNLKNEPVFCEAFAILPLNSKLYHFVEPKVEVKNDESSSDSEVSLSLSPDSDE